MVKTWIAGVDSLKEAKRYEFYYRQAPMERREKVDKIQKYEDKRLSLGAWALYDKAMKTFHIDEGAVYNLSHSGEYVLCSIDTSGTPDAKVGCDIEKMGNLRMNIARRFFCPAEITYLESCANETLRREAFYRYWVLKESFMKATRLGMKLPLNAFEICLCDERGAQLICQPEEIHGTYVYKEYKVETIPYKIAVCTSGVKADGTLEFAEL